MLELDSGLEFAAERDAEFFAALPSLPGVALGPMVIAARQAGLLINGGGHAMAAGFTLEAAKLADFRDFLAARIKHALGAVEPVPELGIDGALSVAAATPALAGILEKLAPFGTGNAEPRFALPNLRILRADVAGENHLRLILGEGAGTARLKGIAFRALENGIGPALLKAQGQGFHFAGHLRANNWQGREEVQLVIDDAAPALS